MNKCRTGRPRRWRRPDEVRRTYFINSAEGEVSSSPSDFSLRYWTLELLWMLELGRLDVFSGLRPPTSGLRFWPLSRGPFWPFLPFFKWGAKKGQKVPKGAKKGHSSAEAPLPKSKTGKEKVKFWMLHQRLTTNAPAAGKETGKGGKGTGKAGPGGWASAAAPSCDLSVCRVGRRHSVRAVSCLLFSVLRPPSSDFPLCYWSFSGCWCLDLGSLLAVRPSDFSLRTSLLDAWMFFPSSCHSVSFSDNHYETPSSS